MKSGYQQITEILNRKSVKEIKSIIYQLSYSNMDMIAESLIDMIAENSNDFTKDIAIKVKNGLTMSEKQAWCIAYQIVNNIEVYILANKEEEKSINIEEEIEKETNEAIQFEKDCGTIKSIIENHKLNNSFIIVDNTANNGKIYISDDGSNSSLKTNAIAFETENEALEFAESFNGNRDWFTICKYSDM
jgi:hypothetical protein